MFLTSFKHVLAGLGTPASPDHQDRFGVLWIASGLDTYIDKRFPLLVLAQDTHRVVKLTHFVNFWL